MEYNFYKMPVSFFENEKYKELTYVEKCMYCVLYARYELSQKTKKFTDELGAYVLYTVKGLMSYMNLSKPTVINGLKHLEECNLIFRKKTDGKADKIYIIEPETVRKSKGAMEIYPNIEMYLDEYEFEILSKIIVEISHKKRDSYKLNHETVSADRILKMLILLDTGDVVQVFNSIRQHEAIRNDFIYLLTSLYNFAINKEKGIEYTIV